MQGRLLDRMGGWGTWWLVATFVLVVGGCGGSEASGAPTPGPAVACQGVPQAPCDDAVASLEGSFGAPIVQVGVACIVAACTATDGQVDIDVLLADGRRESSGYGYGSAQTDPVQVVPPVLPVVPICLGLPFAMCKEMAGGSDAPGGVRPPIVRITVRCKGVCTPTKGEGETRIDFVDGTSQLSGWAYESSGG
jgi:hypothetical protein